MQCQNLMKCFISSCFVIDDIAVIDDNRIVFRALKNSSDFGFVCIKRNRCLSSVKTLQKERCLSCRIGIWIGNYNDLLWQVVNIIQNT